MSRPVAGRAPATRTRARRYTNVRKKFVGRPGAGIESEYYDAMLNVTANSIRRHFVEPNNADVLIYSWNPELREAFERNHRPVAAGYQLNTRSFMDVVRKAGEIVSFERNERSLSWTYTVREGMRLLRKHEARRGRRYENVLFSRPDALVFEDVDMEWEYDAVLNRNHRDRGDAAGHDADIPRRKVAADARGRRADSARGRRQGEGMRSREEVNG